MAEIKINVAVTVDENYMKPLKVMLMSLFCNNKKYHFHVYLIHSGINQQLLKELNDFVISHNHRLHLIEIGDKLFENNKSVEHVTKETFYRLLLPSILPTTIKKILYLDPDILVLGDIGHLYNRGFEQTVLIAAKVRKDDTGWNYIKRRIKIPLSTPYFNAGVLLMNLEMMRNMECFVPAFIFDYMNKNYRYIIEGDQAYLNKFLNNKVKILNTNIYNYDTRIMSDGINYWEIVINRIKDYLSQYLAKKRSIIIHYRGKTKPWSEEYNGKLGSLWNKYACMAGEERTKHHFKYLYMELVKKE